MGRHRDPRLFDVDEDELEATLRVRTDFGLGVDEPTPEEAAEALANHQAMLASMRDQGLVDDKPSGSEGGGSVLGE